MQSSPVVRLPPIFGLDRLLEGDCSVANARQGNHPGCALRLALASDQLGPIRKLEGGGLLEPPAMVVFDNAIKGFDSFC